MNWTTWRRYFEQNADRALPAPKEAGPVPEGARRLLARSLAVFQLGEAGEGRIATQVNRFAPPTVDEDWRVSLRAWVREEGRHGRVLGACVRTLGGRPLTENWTNQLLVWGRRLVGVRLKVLVILSAEVIGLTFYGAIAEALGPGPIAEALEFIQAEERAHLAFHVDFFHAETRSPLRRLLFSLAWALVGSAAGLVVLLDHRQTLNALGIEKRAVARAFARWLCDVGQAVLADPARLPGRSEAQREPLAA